MFVGLIVSTRSKFVVAHKRASQFKPYAVYVFVDFASPRCVLCTPHLSQPLDGWTTYIISADKRCARVACAHIAMCICLSVVNVENDARQNQTYTTHTLPPHMETDME